MKKKFLSVLLILCLSLSVVPMTSFAATPTATAKDITLGTSALKGGQASNVYFGTYQQSSLGNTEPTDGAEGVDWIKSETAKNKGQGAYYSKDPIKWRVLSNDESKLFLLSDKNLDVVRYNKSSTSVTWETSTIRSWLNGTNTENFYGSAFSTAEKGVIADTTVVNDDNSSFGTVGGNNTTDKVFLLSIAEAQNTAYGFTGDTSSTDTRKAVNTAYVYGGGKTGTSGMLEVGRADFWWLRSPGSKQYIAANVSYNGGVNGGGSNVDHDNRAIRPALNLKLSSVLFTSAAVGGKSSNAAAGGVAENKNLSDITGNDGYKLTLLDSTRNSFSASLKSLSDNTVTVSYLGAKTGANEFISVIIKNGDTVKYYGRVTAASAANGNVDITLPSDFSTENGDVLCVFNEQYNGDKMTDYASDLIDVTPFDYTVNFNANGATGAMASQTMTYGIASSLSANTFTRNGYTFNGWNTEPDGNGTEYTDGQSVTNLVPDASTPSVTLYAQWKDTASPVFSGIVNGKTYCGEVKFKVTDNVGVASVSFVGRTLTADADGYYTIEAGAGFGQIVAKDAADNRAYCAITVNSNHICNWKDDGSYYWQECSNCDYTTKADKKAIPNIQINIIGADKVCRTDDYVFSFGIPEGCKNADGYIDLGKSTTTEATVTEKNGVITITVPAAAYKNFDSFTAVAIVTLEDGYPIEVTKAVIVQNEHSGGTADCTHKAICEVCGEEYGEVDSGNHDLENIKGNAATVTEKGNTEYWHCKDCDGNFSDKDGKNAIDLKDTVIGKLPPEIIDGKGQSLTEGERCELIFRSNAAFGDFIRVELDGETVDGKNYTVKEGSTIVTLKADYVATLSVGEHTLGIVSESGTATTTFTVNAKAVDTNSPQTGDNSRMALWFALLFVSGGAFAGITVYSKKKKRFVK